MSAHILLVLVALPLAWGAILAATRAVAGRTAHADAPDDRAEKRWLALMLLPLTAGTLLIALPRPALDMPSVPWVAPTSSVMPGDTPAMSRPAAGVRPTPAPVGPVVPLSTIATVLLTLLGAISLARVARLAFTLVRMRRIVAAAVPDMIAGTAVRIIAVDWPPLAWGRATIVLPRAIADRLDDDAMAMIIRHERAHLARRDPLFFTLLAFVDALSWFDPFVRAQTGRCRLAAEIAADAAVLAEPETARRRYAETLIETLRLAIRTAPRCVPCIASFTKGDHHMRIRIIMASASNRRRHLPLPARTALALLGTPLFAAQVAWSQGPATPAPMVVGTAQHYSIATTPICELLRDPAAKAVLDRHIEGRQKKPENGFYAYPFQARANVPEYCGTLKGFVQQRNRDDGDKMMAAIERDLARVPGTAPMSGATSVCTVVADPKGLAVLVKHFSTDRKRTGNDDYPPYCETIEKAGEHHPDVLSDQVIAAIDRDLAQLPPATRSS